jgi:hypothetical protein
LSGRSRSPVRGKRRWGECGWRTRKVREKSRGREVVEPPAQVRSGETPARSEIEFSVI